MDTLYIWLLVYFILASQFYLLDKKGKFFLGKLYLFLYNLGHRQEITEAEVTKGFVYNQNLGTRLTAAFIFDLILSLIFWKFNTLGSGIKIILLFIGTPIVFLGFWFGGVLMAFFSKVFSKTVSTIDDISTGKIDPVEEIQRSFDEVKDTVEESLHKSFSAVTTKEEPKSGSDAESGDTAAAQQSKEDEDALAALREFQKGNK
ncbi:MAG: hypothetical protein D3903_11915, partial [Candidatus Electrothrix sp. GM3_4]|nr:hypothetical protein [Candidatus Electrothrix sp. GM3_4]